jgi:hypothetical protein
MLILPNAFLGAMGPSTDRIFVSSVWNDDLPTKTTFPRTRSHGRQVSKLLTTWIRMNRFIKAVSYGTSDEGRLAKVKTQKIGFDV